MNRFFDLVLLGYQRAVSPVLVGLGCSCRFHPTCSAYAREAVRIHSWWRAAGLILRRLVKCGPWHPGGIDAVPYA